jgi:polysaccharide chain length determinant protein (PEP-CTERM system associated)
VERQDVSDRYVTPNTTVDVRDELLSMANAILSQTQLNQIIDEFSLYPEERKEGSSPEQLVDLMRQRIKIEPLQKAGQPQNLNVFTISFAGVDGHQAQEVTAKLTNLFMEGSDKSRGEQSKGTTDFLSAKLQSAAEELKQQESRVRAYKMQNIGELPEQEGANLASLTGMQSELQNTNATLAHAREQEAYLQSLLSQYESMAASQAAVSGPGDTSLQDTFRAELTQLRKEKADLLAKYTAEYPDVVRVNEQIRETEAQLAASTQAPPPAKEGSAPEDPKSDRPVESNPAIAQVKSQLEANRLIIKNALGDAKQIEARIDDLEHHLNLTPVREAQLAELLRGYDQAKQRFDDLSTKQTQSELATSLEMRQQGDRFDVIDPPSLPMAASNPQRMKLSLAGFGLGIALGVALAFLIETTDHSLRNEEDLRTTFSLPLLLGVPLLLSKVDERRRSRRAGLEWVLGTALCLLMCATEFYVYRRG